MNQATIKLSMNPTAAAPTAIPIIAPVERTAARVDVGDAATGVVDPVSSADAVDVDPEVAVDEAKI